MHSTDLPPDGEGGSMSRNDSGFLMALRGGSEAAFAELHRRYGNSLYRKIVSITKNHEDAEDVLQDTLMRAYMGLDSFQGRSKLQSWLTRIAINSSLMTLRKRRVRREANFSSFSNGCGEEPEFEIKDSSPNPEQLCLTKEDTVRMTKAVAGLKPALRSAIEIQIGGGSMEEIAQFLGVSVPAVKARLHRARKHVAKRTERTGSFAPRGVTSAQVSLG